MTTTNKTRKNKIKITNQKAKQQQMKSCRTKKYQAIYGINCKRLPRSLFF